MTEQGQPQPRYLTRPAANRRLSRLLFAAEAVLDTFGNFENDLSGYLMAEEDVLAMLRRAVKEAKK